MPGEVDKVTRENATLKLGPNDRSRFISSQIKMAQENKKTLSVDGFARRLQLPEEQFLALPLIASNKRTLSLSCLMDRIGANNCINILRANKIYNGTALLYKSPWSFDIIVPVYHMREKLEHSNFFPKEYYFDNALFSNLISACVQNAEKKKKYSSYANGPFAVAQSFYANSDIFILEKYADISYAFDLFLAFLKNRNYQSISLQIISEYAFEGVFFDDESEEKTVSGEEKKREIQFQNWLICFQ